MQIDAIDVAIIEQLQVDGRVSSSALAERVGLSPSATLRRINRLEDSGLVEGYAMLLSPQLLGLSVSVFTEVSLDSQAEEILDEFEAAISSVPEVRTCHLMAGQSDYLIHLMCVDVADYERVHRQHLASLPHVSRLRSSFAIRQVCARTEYTVTAGELSNPGS